MKKSTKSIFAPDISIVDLAKPPHFVRCKDDYGTAYIRLDNIKSFYVTEETIEVNNEEYPHNSMLSTRPKPTGRWVVDVITTGEHHELKLPVDGEKEKCEGYVENLLSRHLLHPNNKVMIQETKGLSNG